MRKRETPEENEAARGKKKGVVKQFPSGREELPTGGGTQNDRLKESKSGRVKKTRRKERMLMGSAVILLLALAMICLLLFFKVQEITVVDSAQQRYSNDALIAASGIETGDSMLWLKEEDAAARLVTDLPFLESAQVKKKFPSRVEITVTYARPAMAIKADDGYILLSVEGKVLQTGVGALSDYVAELRGATVAKAAPGENVVFTDEALFGQVTTLAKAFADAGYLNVTVYDVSDLQNVTVEVEYKVDVKLGSIGKVEGKLAFGKEVIARSLADSRHSSSKVVVDLTTENTAYVRSQADIDAAANAKRTADVDQTDGDGTDTDEEAPDEEAPDDADAEEDAD